MYIYIRTHTYIYILILRQHNIPISQLCLICIEFRSFFPNSVSYWGLQPRIAPVCTGAGAGSGSTRFRRRFPRFRRRSGRLWRRARSGSTRFRRRFRRSFQEALVQSQGRFNGFRRRLQRRSRRWFWESLGQVRFNRFNRISSAWPRSTLQKDL